MDDESSIIFCSEGQICILCECPSLQLILSDSQGRLPSNL